MIVHSVKQHEKFSQVIVVQDINGFEVSYLMTSGTLIPGRIWLSTGPGGERVSLFLTMPDGTPTVLMVETAEA